MSHFKSNIDEVTLKAACKNNAVALKKIYQAFSTPVYNLIFRITQNQADALDISQDVFIKVLTKLPQNKSPQLLGFWIRKITLNTTMTYLKKNTRLISNINFKEKSIDTNTTEIMSGLEFALSKLSAISRSVLWLYEVEGMSHQEIAELHGKTVSFSKTHLSRAKQTAQKYLTGERGGYKAQK